MKTRKLGFENILGSLFLLLLIGGCSSDVKPDNRVLAHASDSLAQSQKAETPKKSSTQKNSSTNVQTEPYSLDKAMRAALNGSNAGTADKMNHLPRNATRLNDFIKEAFGPQYIDDCVRAYNSAYGGDLKQ